MRKRILSTLFITVILASCLVSDVSAQQPAGSFLVKFVAGADDKSRVAFEPYDPQPGDLIFFNDFNKKWEFLYRMVGSEAPYHAAIMVRKPDGTIATLESGPND